MCSYFFVRRKQITGDDLLHAANRFARDRGPDSTTVLQFADVHGFQCVMAHNLLDISGQTVQQPLVSGEPGSRRILLFNGEIYNYLDFIQSDADTKCLLPVSETLGDLYSQSLDGEFAALIYEEASNCLQVAVDPFLTKPLFIGRSQYPGEFGVATCASSLMAVGLTSVEMVQPNSRLAVVFGADSVGVRSFSPVVDFDLEQQTSQYDGWIEAFLAAVKKRATHGAHPICVFLSSGYDSGAICLALNLLGIKYTTLSIVGHESASIIRERNRLNGAAVNASSFVFEGLTARQIERISEEIRNHVEPFQYQHFDSPGVTLPLWEDGGAIGAYFLAEQSRHKGLPVNLSGSGADEILSDYGFGGKPMYHHSQFGGLFPEQLHGFFPWKKFYGDTQRSYLFKDEYILGRFGIEGRYPFLDKAAVQQFLSLTADRKNAAYKAPLNHFLRRHGYPFESETKRGFCPADRRTLVQKILQAFSLR